MKTTISFLVLLGVLLVSPGCQTWQKADQDARAVALVTSQQVVTIKEEFKWKIAAERKFYKAQLDTIEKSGSRSDENLLATERVNFALSQADALVRSKDDITSETIASQLLNRSTNALDELRMKRSMRRAQREATEKSIRELQLLENQYESLSKTLIQLTTPPSSRDQMEQVASFIKSVAENYKGLKEKAAVDSTNK